nr:SWI/SNF complex component SNF12 homolog [Ipomoea batatas]
MHHLSPPQPIHLEHRIKLSGNNPAGSACYDVLVDVPFPIQRELSALLPSTEKTEEIDACDEAICAAIRKIHEHRRRRAFFLGFSQSPVEFINALIDSQGKDPKLVTAEASHNAEKEHRLEPMIVDNEEEAEAEAALAHDQIKHPETEMFVNEIL